MSSVSRRAVVAGMVASAVPVLTLAQDEESDLEANKALVAGWIEATNAHDLSNVDQFIHDDYSTPSIGALPGKEAYMQRLASNWAEPGVFSSSYIVITFMVAERDRVGVSSMRHISWNNAELQVPEYGFYLIQDGLIIEAQGAFDEAEFQRQISG